MKLFGHGQSLRVCIWKHGADHSAVDRLWAHQRRHGPLPLSSYSSMHSPHSRCGRALFQGSLRLFLHRGARLDKGLPQLCMHKKGPQKVSLTQYLIPLSTGLCLNGRKIQSGKRIVQLPGIRLTSEIMMHTTVAYQFGENGYQNGDSDDHPQANHTKP